MTRSQVLLALVIGTSAACASARVRTAAELQSDEQAIRELDRQWVANVASKDVERTIGVYAPNAVFMAPNAAQASGTAAIRTAWGSMLGMPGVALSFTPSTIRLSQDGTMAYDVGTYTFGVDSPQGRMQDRGKYLVVWEKTNGQWKVVADMFNSDMPAR